MRDKDEEHSNILRAADKHPNSRVSKLVRSVEEEQSQKNIVMLLIELAEHAEYVIDFNMSLKFYLNLFEKLGIGRDIVLNEAGLLLLSSSKIYSRRVDYVQELVERQIITLSSADNEIANAKNDQAEPVTEKPKRGRKRLVDTTSDPFEIELSPKKFRKLTEDKRFQAVNNSENKLKAKSLSQVDTEQYIHPSAWIHASIADLENEDEIDCKRNYKLFTYHVEHRYNTLVPDINFRLHFKVKDYIDEEEERMEEEYGESGNYPEEHTRVWPPLSEEYVAKYLMLENKIFEEEIMPPQSKRLRITSSDVTNSMHENDKTVVGSANAEADKTVANPNESLLTDESGLGTSLLDATSSTNAKSCVNEENTNGTALQKVQNLNNSLECNSDVSIQNDSAIGDSLLESSQEQGNSEVGKVLESSQSESSQNDSALTDSLLETSKSTEENTTLSDEATEVNVLNENKTDESNLNDDKTTPLSDGVQKVEGAEDTQKVHETENEAKTKDDTQINLEDIRVILHHDDEGVYFSDLDEQEQRMLSPTVLATDVFPAIPDKDNLTLIVDDEIKALLNLPEDDQEPETYELPAECRPKTPPIILNIFKINEKFLRRRVLFKLGPDMELFLQQRLFKRSRGIAPPEQRRQFKLTKWFPLNNTDITGVYITPPASPGHEEDFEGFSEHNDDESQELPGLVEPEQKNADEDNHRLSRDSGVGADVLLTPVKEKNLDTIMEESADKVAEETNTGQAGQKEECATALFENGTMNIESDMNQQDSGQHAVQEGSALEATNHVTGESQLNADGETLTKELSNNEETVNALTREDTSLDDGEFDAEELTSNQHRSTKSHAKFDEEINDTLAAIELSSSKTKIQKWHEHLQPILAKSRERHHFDVFQIGTEIMDTLQVRPHQTDSDDGDNCDVFEGIKSITFQDVMENKDPSYVSRYFLSSLLLANQSNIKIKVKNQSSEQPSAWNDIHFDLLSTKRHTVAIEDNIGMIRSAKTQNATNTNYSSSSKTNYKNKTTQKLKYHTTINAKGDSDSSSSSSTQDDYDDEPLSSQSKRLAYNRDVVNVNLNVVKPLKHIEKMPRNSDDYDSGIFSSEELIL